MRSRSGATPTPSSRVWMWAALWLVVVAALVGSTVSVSAPHFGWLVPYSGWLATGIRPMVLDTILLLLAVALAWLTRRILLIISAARAGPVEISSRGGPVPPDALTAFRKALTAVYLCSPSTVPGESSPHDFLSDVREAAAAKTAWGVALLAVASVFRVRAYQVSCAALDLRDGQLGMSLEVSSRVDSAVQVTEISGTTWDDVARRAACHVAAYVLPRTSLSRKPPWTPWRHSQLNPDLFFHFQEARRLAETGRLEESLWYFEKTADLDPLNPYIRLEKATVLDQLGLYVDALAEYVDVVHMESWYDRRLWNRFRTLLRDGSGWDTRPPRFRGSPNGPAALQLARYRVVCSLAASERVARQWHRHAVSTSGSATGAAYGRPPLRRSRDALRAIERLRPLLSPYYEKMMNEYGCRTSRPKRRQIENSKPTLRRVLQYAAWCEARNLERDYRWHKLRRWPGGLLISQPAIRFLPPWAAFQLRRDEDEQSRKSAPPPGSLEREFEGTRLRLGIALPHKLLEPLDEDDWPPDVGLMRAAVRWALGLRAGKRGWLEHYNAACTFAVGMLRPDAPAESGTLTEEESDTLIEEKADTLNEEKARREAELAALSIGQLSQAVAASDSQFASGISPWLRWEDQDLDVLRVTELYSAFVGRYLPSGGSSLPMPPIAPLLTVNARIVRLVHSAARVRQELWEQRARHPVLVTWGSIVDDAGLWKLLGDYCLDYGDWHTRWQFIRASWQPDASSFALDASIIKPEDDDEWGELAADHVIWLEDAKREIWSASDADPVLNQVRSWLWATRDLQRRADHLLEIRNRVLCELGMQLTTPECLGSALAAVASAAQFGSCSPPPGSARILADTWRMVAENTGLARPDDGWLESPKSFSDIKLLRGHFGLNGAVRRVR